jgi:hypothetical protein
VFGFSEWRFGAHAEYLTMPEDGSLATVPRVEQDSQVVVLGRPGGRA